MVVAWWLRVEWKDGAADFEAQAIWHGEAATRVAQTVCLLYRGLAIRRRHPVRTPADCQSVPHWREQVANLRYKQAMRRHKFTQANKIFIDGGTKA